MRLRGLFEPPLRGPFVTPSHPSCPSPSRWRRRRQQGVWCLRCLEPAACRLCLHAAARLGATAKGLRAARGGQARPCQRRRQRRRRRRGGAGTWPPLAQAVAAAPQRRGCGVEPTQRPRLAGCPRGHVVARTGAATSRPRRWRRHRQHRHRMPPPPLPPTGVLPPPVVAACQRRWRHHCRRDCSIRGGREVPRDHRARCHLPPVAGGRRRHHPLPCRRAGAASASSPAASTVSWSRWRPSRW